jgi:hypothetical protein
MSTKPFRDLKKSSRSAKLATLSRTIETLSGGDSPALLKAFFSSRHGKKYQKIFYGKYRELVSSIHGQYQRSPNQKKRQFLSFLVDLEDRSSLEKDFKWKVGKEAWRSAVEHYNTQGAGNYF